jgi:mRNA-degrading endonuclease RelE of RelBE toxin-antitoxin system
LTTSSVRRSLQRTKRFGRDIKKILPHVQQKAYEIARKLATDVFDPELNVRELTGFRGNYRVVVLSDYRLIFSFDADNIYLLRIAHRKDIYRNLDL